MKPTQVLASVLALSTVTSAWPWPPSLGDIKTLAQENGLYQKRQNDGGGNNGGGDNNNQGGGGDNNNPPPASSAQATASGSGSAAPPDTTQASNTDNASSNTDSASGSNTASASNSDSSITGSNSNSDSQPSATSSQYTDDIPLGAQPGGVNMIEPNTFAASQYYKVDQTITWQWNYTSLSRPPSAIDIIATVSGGVSSANPSPFTLATNYTFAPTQTFTWDTGKYVNETSALPVGTYTLQIFDAGPAGGVSATVQPGYLAPYQQFRFGMYTGQPGTPLAAPYMCSTCNSANGRMEGQIIWTVVGTASLTVASFFWFAGGWGVV